MTDDKKPLIKYSYNQLAKRNLTCRFIFDDWIHLDRLNSRLGSRSRILDVGCGSGIPIDKYLIEKGHKVTGVDLSDEQISLAKENLPNGNFLVKDMENLDFPKDSFDAIISFYSIFHIEKVKHPKLLKSFYDFLKPNGYMMVTLGSKDYEDTTEEYEDIKLFWSHWGKDRNLEILRETGLNVLYEEIHIAGNEEHLIVLAQKSKLK